MCPPGGTVLGPKMGPKIGPRAAQNWIHFWTYFWSNFGVAFKRILGAIWAPRLARERSGGAQESQVELQEAKKTTFKKVVFA